MKLLVRLALAIALLLGVALPVAAQYTVVSSTSVTDSAGIVYNGGTYNINLVNNTGQPAYFQGAPLPSSLTFYSGTLSTTGAFSATIPSSAFILAGNNGPANQTTWNFTVCAKGGFSCYSVATAVSGSSQNVTTTINAGAVALIFTIPNIPPGPTGYVVTANPLGFGYAQSAAANGTGGATNPAAPVMALYYSNVCPPANTGNCFFTPGNLQQAVDCGPWTTSSTTITCVGSHFVPADVGKRIQGWKTCNAESTALASNAAATALVNGGVGLRAMTIASYVSGTTITVSQNPDNAASGSTNCIQWATPDDTYAAALDTAAQASTTCPKIYIAGGYYYWTVPHLFTQPTSCAQLGTIYQGAQANTVYAAGYEIEGRGTGPTQIVLSNDFGAGTCTNGFSALACFVRTLNGRWSHLLFTGGQNAIGNTQSPTYLFEVDGPGSMDNITCTNFGGANTNVYGFLEQYWDRWYQVNNSGCGGVGVKTGIGGSTNTLVVYKMRIENNPIALINAGASPPGSVTCIDCGFLGAEFTTNTSGLIENTTGGTIELEDSQTQNLNAGTGFIAYNAATTAGATLYLKNTSLGTSGGSNQNGISCSVACNNFVQNSNMGFNGAGKAYTDAAGSNFYDQGGNQTGGAAFTAAAFSISGAVHGSNSVIGTLVTGSVALSTCGTSTVTAVTTNGGPQAGEFTITYAGTPGTTCTATLTFPGSQFAQAPQCRWSVQGGTNTQTGINIVKGATSATSAAVTISGPTFTAANTQVIDYECGNP